MLFIWEKSISPYYLKQWRLHENKYGVRLLLILMKLYN